MTDHAGPDGASTPARPERMPHRRRPGYRECERILDRLRRFQDLVRHHQRWASEIERARPLEELLPEGTKPTEQPSEIKRQIRRLIPLVARDLTLGGVQLGVRRVFARYDPEKRRSVEEFGDRDYHLINDYFALPNDARASSLEQLTRALACTRNCGAARERNAGTRSLGWPTSSTRQSGSSTARGSLSLSLRSSRLTRGWSAPSCLSPWPCCSARSASAT